MQQPSSARHSVCLLKACCTHLASARASCPPARAAAKKPSCSRLAAVEQGQNRTTSEPERKTAAGRPCSLHPSRRRRRRVVPLG